MRARSAPMDGIGSLTDAPRYDLLLAAVPVAFAAGVIASALGVIALTTGVGAGATLAAALVGYALFVAPPGRGGRRRGPGGSSGSGSSSVRAPSAGRGRSTDDGATAG